LGARAVGQQRAKVSRDPVASVLRLRGELVAAQAELVDLVAGMDHFAAIISAETP
jgi:hypothetical protein